jgi:hypothetical protein
MEAREVRRLVFLTCGGMVLLGALLTAHGPQGEAAAGQKPTHTPKRTETSTSTATRTPTSTATSTASATATWTASATATATSTATATASLTPTPSGPQVPAEFQAQATFVAAKLEEFKPGAAVGSASSVLPATRFGAELYIANSNRGEALLNEDAYTSISLQLRRLQELGVRGVTVTIHEDVLARSPRAAEYLALYGRIAVDVKARGLLLVVESSASLVADYGALTFDQYRQSRRLAIERILAVVRPDYLAIGTEPTTEAGLTRFPEIATPAGYRDLIAALLFGLERGRTLIGAGAGTWEDRAYIEEHLVQLGLDFLGLHVYPVGQDFLPRIVSFAEVARRYGKRTLIGEAWLYKATDAELVAQLPPGQIYARDVFSFWQTLDEKFLQKIVEAARAQQVDYVSAFWAQYFFAYLEYNDLTARLTPVQATTLVGTDALLAMVQGTYTTTGLYYRDLIAAATSP